MSKSSEAIIEHLIVGTVHPEALKTIREIEEATKDNFKPTTMSNKTEPISFSHMIERYKVEDNPYSNIVEEYVESQKGLILYTKKVLDWKGTQIESHTKTLLDRRDKVF